MQGTVVAVQWDPLLEEYSCEIQFNQNPRLIVGTEIEVINLQEFENIE